MTRLTCREQLQLLTLLQVERLQVAEISEAFGHHISKIRNKSEVIGDLLAGRLWI